MWARDCEAMIGCWLLASPFIFGHPDTLWLLWATDLGAGLATIVLALASYWRPLRHAHLAILLVAAWLLGFGRLSGSPPLAPALQNDILVGLVLLLFAIVPNRASDPPAAWQEWRQR
jgi:hypothetical protein